MIKEEAAKHWETGRAILRYLNGEPAGRTEAKDTLEGIARWWLELQRTERLLRDVEQALDLLLSQNLIIETRRLGTPPYYQVNPEQREAIEKVLEDS